MTEISKILIITLIVYANARNFQVGDTVNIFDRTNLKDKVVSDIFNGFDGSKFIKKTDRQLGFQMEYETCMLFESLKNYFYPKVFINNRLATNVSNLFRFIDSKTDEYFRVNPHYVHNQYFRYGIVKLCRTVEEQNLNIRLIDSSYFPKIIEHGNYNIIMNKTVLFRLKRDNETHYVSAVSTGTCLIQISINDGLKCLYHHNKSHDQAADFFKTSITRTSFTTISNNQNLEHTINEYYFLNNIEYSLFAFPNIELFHQEKILEKFGIEDIIRISLQKFPELPTVKFGIKQIPSSTLKPVKRDDVTPGDMFNYDELFESTSGLVTTKNVLMNRDDGVTLSFVTYNLESCRKNDKKDPSSVKDGKLDVFDEMLNHKNFGIERQKYNILMTCLKITICSGFKKQTLNFSPITVIKLNENSKNSKKYNIFENKNIMLWFSEGNETHFATRTEKGDCLSQTIVYSDKVHRYNRRLIFQYDPIHFGPILSATENSTLEEQVKRYVNNDFRKIVGKEKNDTAILKIFEELEHSSLVSNVLINLYLDEIV